MIYHENAKQTIKRLQGWYDSIMDAIEKYDYGSFYKCGKCGGPVAKDVCCAWCGTDEPVTLGTGSCENCRHCKSGSKMIDGIHACYVDYCCWVPKGPVPALYSGQLKKHRKQCEISNPVNNCPAWEERR